jgi:hypothetical protein
MPVPDMRLVSRAGSLSLAVLEGAVISNANMQAESAALALLRNSPCSLVGDRVSPTKKSVGHV